MSEITDDTLRKLAFQRGVLTLLKESDRPDPMIEKALEHLDGLIVKLMQR